MNTQRVWYNRGMMYALWYTDPYGGDFPMNFFDNSFDAETAQSIVVEHDRQLHPGTKVEDWDYAFVVRPVKVTRLSEFKELYKMKEEIYEEVFSGGNDCFIGRGLFNGDNG